MSVWWLGMALRGYKVADDRIWARKLFGFSIIAITALSVMMSVDFMVPDSHTLLAAVCRTRIRCWLLCGNTTSQLKRCYGTFFLSIRIISLSKYLLKNPHVYPIRLPLVYPIRLPLYTSREFKTEVVMNDYKMTPGERRATWGLGTVFSLRMLGMFMVLPVLTTYGMALQGASEALIGIAIGIYGLTQAVFQIPFGLLSDRIGRKPLIVGGLAVFAAGSVIAALSDSIWGIILGRALQGSGAIAAAVMALLSDLTREQNRTKAMAFIGVSFGITFAIAMVLGPIITHKLGLHALFWMIAILATTGIALTIWVVPNSSTHVLNRESVT